MHLALCFSLVCLLTLPAAWGYAGDSVAERTLSPYFLVEGGETSGEQFPLLGTQVDVAISGVIAKVTVRQQYTNRGAQPIHARYIFPGSTRAAVHGLKMIIGERVITAQIKEKDAARQLYAAAKREGKNALLLEQQRPNVFSMEVANIMPGDRIDVTLEYTELLVPENGTYAFVYPTVVGPRYSNQPAADAPPAEQWVANPYLKQGAGPRTSFDITATLSAGMPVQDVVCASHPATVNFDRPDKATVSLLPGEFGGNRDYVLRYRLADQAIASGLLLFAGDSEVMAPTSVPATAENLHQALALIDRQQGSGGTELVPAMRRALALPKREGTARTMLVITDGFIAAERDVFTTIQENLDKTNVFAFGIGSSVNRYLIEGMAKSGQGEPFVVMEPGEAPAVAQQFRDYVSAPVLTSIKIEYQGFDAYDVEPLTIPDLFAQRPLIVFGKWRGERAGTITLSGRHGTGLYSQAFPVDQVEPEARNEALKYLWARERIARLSDYNARGNTPGQREAIVNLGLRYNLLTAHTSFVAVDEVIRNTGTQGQDVKQPLPLPKGVSNLAVGGAPTPVPEPEYWLLVLASLVLAAFQPGRLRAWLRTLGSNR